MHSIEDISKPVERLGRAVKTRRRDLSLTQQQLGDLAGCGRLFVHQLEKGKTTVRLDKLLDVMTILGLRLTIENGTDAIVDGNDASD